MNAKDRIKKALIILLNNKSLHEIQVKELVEASDVSRSSFYRLYDTIFDVYNELKEEFICKIVNINTNILQAPLPTNPSEPDPYILATCQFFYDNKSFSLAMMNDKNLIYYVEDSKRLFREHYSARVACHLSNVRNIDLYTTFTTAGALMLIRYWLQEREDLSPKDFSIEFEKLMLRYYIY